jgi:hypothetical protein
VYSQLNVCGPALPQLRNCFAFDEVEGRDGDAQELRRRQGGHPRIVDLPCAFDYDAHIGEHVDSTYISGFGSFKRLVTEPGHTRPTLQTTRSMEVAVLQFFLPEGSDLAKCRYKTSSGSDCYLPIGANGRNDIGIHIFKADVTLPDLDVKPPLAEFSYPWKNMEEVTNQLTTMHDSKPLFQTKQQQDKWIQFFHDAPESSSAVPLADQPGWELRAAPALTHSPFDARGGEGSMYDPPARPAVDSVTDRDYPPGQKKKDVAAQLAGAYNCACCDIRCQTCYKKPGGVELHSRIPENGRVCERFSGTDRVVKVWYTGSRVLAKNLRTCAIF